MTTARMSKMNRHSKLAPIHPGEVLREDFMTPTGTTAYALAKALGISQTRLSEVIKGKRAVTADTALRLAQHLGTSAEFWMHLQAGYDLDCAADALDIPRSSPPVIADPADAG